MPYLVILRRGVSSNLVVCLSDTKKTPFILKEFICTEMESAISVLARATNFASRVSKFFEPILEIKKENV